MLNDAVADERIPSSPCVLKDELPAKRDKDRKWRRTVVFTCDEVESIIAAESTPGRPARARVADVPGHEEVKVKGTKTENPREMPVHPTLDARRTSSMISPSGQCVAK
jgi:hypothetical protein